MARCSTLPAKHAPVGTNTTSKDLIRVNTCFTDPLGTLAAVPGAFCADINITDLTRFYSLCAILTIALDLLSAKPTLLRWGQLRSTRWARAKVSLVILTKEAMGIEGDGIVRNAVGRATFASTTTLIVTDMVPAFAFQHVFLTDSSMTPSTGTTSAAHSRYSSKYIVTKPDAEMAWHHMFVAKLT